MADREERIPRLGRVISGRPRAASGSRFSLVVLGLALLLLVLVGQRVSSTAAPLSSADDSASGAVQSTVVVPSDSSASPVQTPLVQSSVVPRVGVPADLVGRMWSTEFGEAGLLGTTARIGVPAGERIVAIGSPGLVVSVLGAERSDPAGSSSIRVRDITTGDVVATFESNLYVTHAAVALDRLFFTGRPFGVEGPVDGGVWAADISAPDLQAAMVVAPETRMNELGYAERGIFHVSDSGSTVSSVVGFMSTGTASFIDVQELAVRATLTDRIVYAISDGLILTSWEGAEGGSEGVALLNLADGREVWHYALPGSAMPMAVLLTDHRLVVEYQRETNAVVASADLASGTFTDIATFDLDKVPLEHGAYLIPELSSADHLVLLRELGVQWALAASDAHQAEADVIDLTSGAIDYDAFQIGAP